MENFDYNIFFEFIKDYSGNGFSGISNQDHFMTRMNHILDKRQQYFYIADLMKLQLLYTSPQVFDITGFEPEKYDLSYNLKYTHPIGVRRRSRLRANVIEAGQELFINRSGELIVSSNFNMKRKSGEYSDVLFQCYIFYSRSPFETVYALMVCTQVEWSSKIIRKGHYHWYSGTDMSYFRYPDDELLHTGSNLSDRELEVIKCVQKGMASKEISDKLFLSPHTVNTHRKNILKKAGKASLSEVVYELVGIGMI